MDLRYGKRLQQLLDNAPKLGQRLRSFSPTATSSRTVESTAYGFRIDTTRAQLIQTASYNSYAFVVERDTETTDVLENYIYTEFSDGSHKQYLIAYPILGSGDGARYYIANATVTPISDNSLMSRDQGATTCIEAMEFQESVCTDIVCSGPNSGQHTIDDGSNCLYFGTIFSAQRTCTQAGWIETGNCTSTGGGSGTTQPNDPPDGTPGGGSGDDPNDDEEVIIPFSTAGLAFAIFDCLQEGNFSDMFSTLDLMGYNAATSVYNYLIVEGNCSEEAKGFTIAALEALQDNNNDGLPDAEVDWEDEIILNSNFANNQRLKCIFDRINLGNNAITDYLENFLGERPVAHLKLSTDDNFGDTHDPGAGAVTLSPQNYVIEIVFNTDPNLTASAINFPTIVLATDMLHEILHAELYRKLLSVAQTPSLDLDQAFINSVRNDFPSLYYYYTRYWFNVLQGQQLTSAQHALMAENYRGMIIDALKQYDNNAHDDFFYETLSWSGLTGTPAWNNLSQQQQTNFINQFNTILANETFNCI